MEDFVAADMFKDLVEKGFNNAYYGLGLCYYRGIGTYIDFDKALHTLKTGAKLGDADCCYQLGKFFMDGMLLEQDEELAEEYWLKGAEQKHTNCVRALAEYYYSQGSPEAILKSMHCHSILDRKGIESSKDWLCCYCSNNNITLHELNAKIRENPLGIQFTKSV